MSAGETRLRRLLVLDLIALLFALSCWAITAQEPAERALGRSVAILTQVDSYVDEHFASIQQAASESPGQVTPPDFPVPVSFSAEELQQADRERFRALLIERAAAVLHDDGTSAFRLGQPSEAGLASPAGAIRAGMDLLRPVPHRAFAGLAIATALAAGLLALALGPSRRGCAGLRRLGVDVLIASVAFLILAAGARLALWLAAVAADDYLAREFLTLAGQLTWAAIRGGLIVMVGGAGVAAAGAILAREARRRRA